MWWQVSEGYEVENVAEDANSLRYEIVSQLPVETVFRPRTSRKEAISDGLGIKVRKILRSEAADKEFLKGFVEAKNIFRFPHLKFIGDQFFKEASPFCQLYS